VAVVEGTVTKLIKETRHGQETVVGVEYKAKDGIKVRTTPPLVYWMQWSLVCPTGLLTFIVTTLYLVQQVRSALTVICDGCFSRFRDQLEEATPRNVSKFVGILMNVRPSPTLLGFCPCVVC
jgi:hypothetical protein